MDSHLPVPEYVRVITLSDAYVSQDCKGVTVCGGTLERYQNMGITDIICAAARIGEGGLAHFAGVTRLVLMARDRQGDITYVDSDGDYQTIKCTQVGNVVITKP
jgi:hypothetical protein